MDLIKGTTLSTLPSTFYSGGQLSNSSNYIKWYKNTRTLIENYTKDEVWGDFLRPPYKHLTPVAVKMNKFWWYDLEEANNAKDERKLLLRPLAPTLAIFSFNIDKIIYGDPE